MPVAATAPGAAGAHPAAPSLCLSAAGLRRSFRLSRKERRGSSGEGSDAGDPDFLTYEEVTRYQQRPNERPRLVVLIGERLAAATLTSSGGKLQLRCRLILSVCEFRKVLWELESTSSNSG